MDKHLESGSRSITPARAGETGETYELPRVCAMFDKPYVVRVIRGADGLFRLSDIVKVEGGAGAGKGNAAPKAVTLKSSEMSKDSQPSRCPWCGPKSVVFCYACNAWVCRGKTSKRNGEDYFRCRASCGNEAPITEIRDGFEGSQKEAPRTGQGRAALSGPGKQPGLLPATDRLRLKP